MPEPSVDGGDGLANVRVSEKEVEMLSAMTSRTAFATETNPVTGADLGAGQDTAVRSKSVSSRNQGRRHLNAGDGGTCSVSAQCERGRTGRPQDAVSRRCARLTTTEPLCTLIP